MSQYRRVPKGAVVKGTSSDTSYHDTNTARKAAYRAMKEAKRKRKKA